MFWWKKEKIEPYEEIPREDATPLEALWISGEASKDVVSIRNVFLALIMQLYRKEYINFEKLSTGEHNIVFSYDTVDFFNSNYKKIMEDYSCFDAMDGSYLTYVGGFYNGILKMIESSIELMEELEIEYDELAMLNIIKVVNYEHEGIATLKNIVDTILRRDTRNVDNAYIESLIFVINNLLAKSMIKKGFLIEEELKDKKIFDIKNHPDKYNEESKLWKGLKEYLWKDLSKVMQNDKEFMSFYPYVIIFGLEERIDECIKNEEVYLKSNTIDLVESLQAESEVLYKLDFEYE